MAESVIAEPTSRTESSWRHAARTPGLWHRFRASRAVAGIAIAVTWLYILPTGSKVAAAGVDPSWMAALQMAQHAGLQQGTEVSFTYGPLGYLTTDVYVYTLPWLLATAATWSMALALPLIVHWLLRARLATGTAGIITAVLVTLVLHDASVSSPAVWSLTLSLLALGMIVRGSDPAPWLIAGFGALTSLLVLVSPVAATGPAISFLAASLLPGSDGSTRLRWWQRLATFVGSAGISFAVLWMACGQSPGNLVAWARASAGIVSGYSAAMGLSDATFHVAEVVAAGVLITLTLAIVWSGSSAVPKVRRLVAVGVYLVLAYLAYKHGFVRQDAHVLGFFRFTTLAPLAFLPWIRPRLDAVPVLAGLATMVALLVFGTANYEGWQTTKVGLERFKHQYTPSRHIEAFTDTVALAVSKDRRTETANAGMQNVVRTSGFHQEWTSLFEGQSVHISPWDASLQYGLPGTTWDPAPVFQDYSVYTTFLDDLNSDRFASEASADVVLRRPGAAIDGRLSRWEPPAATLALLCNYSPEADPAAGWMVLRRLDASRCGDVSVTGSASVAMGETFHPPSPEPGAIVVARFSGIADGPVDRLMTALFKAPEIRFETADDLEFRFLPFTQGSWHVISVPGCASSTLDGMMPRDLSSLRFHNDGGPGSWLADAVSDDTFRVEYATIPFSC